MGLFGQATQYLMPPSAPTRKRSQRSKERDIDEYLASDLEVSFASTVSLNSPMKEHLSLTPEKSLGYAEPMDISPAPPSKPEDRKPTSRPRAHTTAATRLFGHDLSNNAFAIAPSPQDIPAPSIRSSVATQSGDKRIQRSALPSEWLSNSHVSEPQVEPNAGAIPTPEPASPADDAMDVDTSYSIVQEVAVPLSFSPAPKSAATTATFSTLFYHSVSPRRSFESPSAYRTKKPRSVSPEPARLAEHDLSSSPGFPPSPSESKLDRMANGKPMLQGLGAPLFSNRPRRPALSSMQPSNIPRSADPSAALDETGDDSNNLRSALPTRRAFSALLPPSARMERFSEESSFEGIDESSPAQAYAKRQHIRTIRRCDGSESLRSLSGSSAMIARESPGRLMGSPYSKYMAPGLSGFGDNEAHGKVLPCHKVTEDGLMRITAETLDNLIDGRFDSHIHDYHIIDCRFDYEYSGGHIPGAVNINTTAAVEELLLGPSLTKPKPSISGDTVRKTILVFHCEFSAKRAPTFAKHLRAKDRAMNNMVYPKIHYPELYVLEGGYCAYFKRSGHRCEPPAYISMDDPKHAIARQQDLDQFRKVKFGRHKSYAYGEAMNKSGNAPQPQAQSKHKSVSAPPVQMFAAANAARGRRKGTLTTLVEDTGNSTIDGDDTDTDIGDSPCPPAAKNGLVKSKKLTRVPLTKAETYGPSRLTLGC